MHSYQKHWWIRLVMSDCYYFLYLITLYRLMMAHYASFNGHFVMLQDKQYFQTMIRLLTKQQLSFETNGVWECVSRTCTNEFSLLYIRDVEAPHVGGRHALRKGGQAPPLSQPIREPWQVAVTVQVVGVQTARHRRTDRDLLFFLVWLNILFKAILRQLRQDQPIFWGLKVTRRRKAQ